MFYSLQGEGARAGSANVFVRFSGCNLRCHKVSHGFDCDTDFTSGEDITGQQLLAKARDLGGDCRSVIFTGGEPALQLDGELVRMFKFDGWYTAIETNGTHVVPGNLDWVCCSPKPPDDRLVILFCSEVKYVRAYGQPLPEHHPGAPHLFVSPAHESADLPERNLQWCINLVKDNPLWRLSVQQHKQWHVR